MRKSELPGLIDWPRVMKQPRYAGGHEDIMRAIFGENAEVIADWVADDYQGTEAFAYKFPDRSVVIMTDYFGTCSGCDAYEDADDGEVRAAVTSLVNSARLFPTVRDAIIYCMDNDKEASEFPFRVAYHLLPLLAEEFVDQHE